MDMFAFGFPVWSQHILLAALALIVVAGIPFWCGHPWRSAARWVSDWFLHQTPLGRLMFVAMFCVATLIGGVKTNSSPRVSMVLPPHVAAPASVTAAEVAAGFRAVERPAGPLAPPPANAVENVRWRLRGAFDDALRIPADGWSYLAQTGQLAGVTVLSRGEFRPDARTPYFPAPFAEPVSLLPEAKWHLLPQTGTRRSVFWHAATPTNTLLLTWVNACAGRDASRSTSFQAEAFPDGRLVYRYADVERMYTPIDPCDSDGDGLANEVDPSPLVSDGVCFGQSEEWIRATFTNADEIVSAGYTNWVSNWVGVNAQNGRYRLSVKFTGAPQRPLRLKVGRFAVMVDAACELVFPLEVDEVHPLEMSRDCEGVDYVWDDGYVGASPPEDMAPPARMLGSPPRLGGAAPGSSDSFDVDFVRPTAESPGYEIMHPRLVVEPDELTVGEAGDGVELTPFINRPSPTYEWHERFGEAEFEATQNGGFWVDGIGGETDIDLTATSGTNTASTTILVRGGLDTPSSPPEGEPPRTDAQLAPACHEVPPPANDVETMPVKWIGFPPSGMAMDAGKLVQTNGTFTIPAGRTCFVGAFVSTTEYPFWTGRIVGDPHSGLYNDLYWWQIGAGRERAEGTGRVGDLHAGLGEGHAADDLSPTVFSGGRFFTAETNADLTVSFTLAVRNQDDALRPTAVKLGIFPMTLAQSNWPVNTNTVYSATDWGVHTNKLIRSKEVAYITGEPAAPALSVKLRGLPDWLTTTWSASITTERPDGRKNGIDDRHYAPTNIIGETCLDIKEWMKEIVGGKVCLTSQVQTTSSNVTEFSLRGKNPLDASARTYIDSSVDLEFQNIAWMIAKHESIDGRRMYNQFNASGRTRELPNKTAGDNAWGWGMCQIDKSTNGTVTAEVYNWQTNVVSMNLKLRESLVVYNQIVQKYENYCTNLTGVVFYRPTNVFTNIVMDTGNGVCTNSVSARDWALMVLYNGRQGCPAILPSGVERRTPLAFDASTSTWVLYPNVRNYVREVLGDKDRATTE